MDFIVAVIFLCIIGAVIGAFARLALPGRDPMGLGMTIAIGVGGALAAGFVGRLLFESAVPSFLMSVVFAALILYFVRRSRGGGLTDPGVPPIDR